MRVTFCGHSTVYEPEVIKEKLYLQIERLIQNGADEFLFGGYGEFDVMSARTVKELKKKYWNVRSVLVIPYLEREWDRELYDQSEYPPIENVPRKFAIIKRNEYMVSVADIVIAYVRFKTGGAWKTYSFAIREKKEVINLCE